MCSGLIQKDKLFTPEQLTELEGTLTPESELTYAQEGIQNQINGLRPDLNERIAQIQQQTM